MKATYTTANAQLVFQLDGSDAKSLFKELAAIQEVFEEPCCGCCKSTNLRYIVRIVEENDYHELHCLSCRARLAFGANKKGGGLFPKRKLEIDGKHIYDVKNKGWAKWVKKPEN